MSGDGVSLPTTLSQLGNVAKAQARGQQTAPQVTPFSEQKDERDEIKVQRVKETSPSEKNRVAREGDENDKRKRRRLKRNRKQLAGAPAETATDDESEGKQDESEDPGTDQDVMGSLIDLRV
jgi:hypothetical protein